MDACLSAFDDVGGLQGRKILEPETRSFAGIVSEPPRLNHLVWPANPCADDSYGILKTDSWDWRVEKFPHEFQRVLGKFRVTQAAPSPVNSRGR